MNAAVENVTTRHTLSVFPLAVAAIALSMLLAAPAAHAQQAASRFTPVAGDSSVKQLADSLGNTPEERQQILQLAGAGRELFEQKYKGKWNNTLAGAMTFFVVAAKLVSSEEKPSAEAEDRLFESLDAMLAKSDIGQASNADKTALYNTLLAGAGLPLVAYVDGKQSGNGGQVEQAKAMAAGFSRKFFKMELPQLVAMLDGGVGGNALAAVAGTSQAPASGSSGGGVDGHYACQVAALLFDGVSYVTQYQPAGMSFTIQGSNYSAQGGGGSIQATADVVSFRGGAYAGWSGARRGDAIVFRKNDYGNPRPGESIKNGDFRCGRR